MEIGSKENCYWTFTFGKSSSTQISMRLFRAASIREGKKKKIKIVGIADLEDGGVFLFSACMSVCVCVGHDEGHSPISALRVSNLRSDSPHPPKRGFSKATRSPRPSRNDSRTLTFTFNRPSTWPLLRFTTGTGQSAKLALLCSKSFDRTLGSAENRTFRVPLWPWYFLVHHIKVRVEL